MKRLSLFLFLVLLIPWRWASADDEANPQQRVSNLGEVEHTIASGQQGWFDDDGFQRSDTDTTCYTINAYQVRRESRESDVVFPSRHKTCIRAERFKVKGALAPVVDPRDR